MSPAEYAAQLAQQTRDFNAGRRAGQRDGKSFAPPTTAFITTSVAFEDGYYTGFRQAREHLLAGRSYEEIT